MRQDAHNRADAKYGLSYVGYVIRYRKPGSSCSPLVLELYFSRELANVETLDERGMLVSLPLGSRSVKSPMCNGCSKICGFKRGRMGYYTHGVCVT